MRAHPRASLFALRSSRLLAFALALAAPAAAQQTSARPAWDYTVTPYFYYSSVDAWWLAGYLSYYQPIADYRRPEPWSASLRLQGGASTEGSYYVDVDADAPAYWDGWRLSLSGTAARANRLGYYGLGNDTRHVGDSVTSTSPYFYAVSRTTQLARLNVQRRIVGPLRVLGGVVYEHTTFRELPGTSQFQRDAASGVIQDGPFSDLAVRGGLVLDTRDNEIDPHQGGAVEALYAAGDHYHRTTVRLQGYVNPTPRLILAGRLAGEQITGTSEVSLMQTIERTQRPTIALGGYSSLRGYYDSRFAGPGKLLGGLEARWALINAVGIFEFKVVGFWDAGRVFTEAEGFQLTTQGLHHSGGAEAMLRIGRNTVVVIGGGWGSEGGQFLFGTTWSY